MRLERFLIPVEESYIFNEAPIYNNFQLWKNGKKNVLYITGLSGGGKGYTAKKIAEGNDDVTIVELDKFENWKWYHDKDEDNLQVSKGDALINTYLYHITRNFTVDPWQTNIEKYNTDLEKFVQYVLSFAEKHPKKRFILEGIQIFQDKAFNFISKDDCIIIIQTAKVQSMQKVMAREHNVYRNHLHTNNDPQGALKRFIQTRGFCTEKVEVSKETSDNVIT